jgi:hypothetical protein
VKQNTEKTVIEINKEKWLRDETKLETPVDDKNRWH